MCETDTIRIIDGAQQTSISTAYELVERELRDYLHAHAARASGAERIETDDETGEIGAAAGSRKLPPLGTEVTTGCGKSHAAAAVAAAAQALGVPVLVLTPTLALADDYVSAIAAAGGNAMRYVARQSPEAVSADAALRPWLCRQTEAVRVAGERNHRPAMSICRECPHGRAAEYRCGVPAREQRALQWFRSHRLEPMDFESCDFLYRGLPAVKSAAVIVAHAAAFSESLAMMKTDGGSIQRLVIVDEAIGLGKLVIAGQKNIEQWIKRIAAIKTRANGDIAKWNGIPGMSDESATWRQIVDLCDVADDAYRQLSAALALRQAPDLASLQRLLGETRRAEQIRSGVAAWERITRGTDHGYSIPLRALGALVESMRKGVARALPTAIEFYEPSPILQWAKKRGSVIFLDATMPHAMRAIIDQLGGRTVRAIARQNLRIERITGCSYSRGIVSREGFAAHARAIWRDLEAAAAQPSGGAWAQIGHLAHLVHAGAPAYGIDVDAERKAGRTNADIAALVAAEFEARHGAALGWWGRHDRGHNLWTGRHLRVFGLPLLGMQAGGDEGAEAGGSLVQEWRLARAAAIVAGCEPGDWPEAVGEMDHVQGRPPLPLDPRVRAWLVDRYAGDLVQAIGRTRAARSAHTIRCELWGGIDCAEMDQALARHGLTVEARWPNEIHVTQRGRPSGATEADMQAAAVKMLADTGKVTVRALCARLRAQGKTADTTKAAAAVRAAKACSKNTIEDSLVFLEQETKASSTSPASDLLNRNVIKEAAGKKPTPAPTPAANDDEAVDLDLAERAEFARVWNRACGHAVLEVSP